jgi:hypothetical protein
MAISGERTMVAETSAAFAGSKVFEERTLYVIVSATIPTVLPMHSTVSAAAPAVPTLQSRVLSTAKSASVTIIGV